MGPDDPQNVTPALITLADRQYGVVAREQLRAIGMSDTEIRNAIRRGRLRRMHRAVYAVGHRALRAEGHWLAAVLAGGPGTALSHRSAAALWELCRSDRGRIDIIVCTRRGDPDPALDVHRPRRLDAADVTSHKGIAVTTVARTLADLAGVVGDPVLARAVAQAEVLGLYDHGALCDVLNRSNGRRGARALRAAIDTSPTFTRSELEGRFLRMCAKHGLPKPLVNVVVCGHEVDFFWPAARLIVETDGHTYHGTRHAFETDRVRDAELTVAGYRVIRITYRRLRTDPAGVAATIRALV
jgi:very-short-patch-repair endonuclease